MGSRERFFDGMHDDERRCSVRVSRLKQAMEIPTVLDALLDGLEVPGKSSVLRKLSDEDKFDAEALGPRHRAHAGRGLHARG